MNAILKEQILNGDYGFDYKQSFSRNIGWVTEAEQKQIRKTKVAIGGLGGVGGSHLKALVRMGFEYFNIADLDDFDYSNFNRQDGANVDTVGLPKAEVSKESCLKINPNCKINLFDEGITEENIDSFLDGVAVYIDSLDIFAVEVRRLVFRKAKEKGIAAFTCAPLAMGGSFLAFTKNSMSFDDYFGFTSPDIEILNRLKDDPRAQFLYRVQNFGNNICRFIAGVGPAAYQRHYLVDSTKVDFFTKNLPSIKPGIDLAAGIMATNVLKFVLKRGKILVAPRSLHFDAYLNKMKKVWIPWGHRNPKQIMVRRIISHIIDYNWKLDRVKEKIQVMDIDRVKSLRSDKDLYNLISDLE